MNLNNFRKNLICWGAADQCMVLKPIIERLGARYDILVDDTPNKVSPYQDVELLSGKMAFESWFKGRNPAEYGFVIAIGNPYGFVRCQLHDYLVDKGLTPVSVCDPSALLDEGISIGPGAQIMKGVIVNAHASIGKQVILNTKSLIEHHDMLGDGVEIGPGATLCGRVNVAKFSWVCAGSTIIPRMSVGENAIVGAGSVVRQTVLDNHVVAGVPAKFLKMNAVQPVDNQ